MQPSWKQNEQNAEGTLKHPRVDMSEFQVFHEVYFMLQNLETEL